jgi:MerR family transcriptional regulator, thiopeptide resistance regulator
MQRELLVERKTRIESMIAAVDETLAAARKGATMSGEDMLKVFGEFKPAEYEAEARDRWGETDAYRESARRTSNYRKEDWQALKQEGDEIQRRMAALMLAGKVPADAEVKACAEAHRRYLERWFYPCSPEMHRRLGELYVDDARFTANIDLLAPGLARFMREAFQTA